MVMTDVGINMEEREEDWKALVLMEVNDVGIDMNEMELQDWKAPVPMPVTVVGIKTEVIVEQPKNA